MIIQAKSYAKINLGLKILGRRPDGYHDIWSVFQTISLHDIITFEKRSDQKLILRCSDPAVPSGDRNLIVRAAKLLRRRILEKGVEPKSPMGATISLDKMIPMGAGLGGGSSNAAVALRVLSKLWSVKNLDKDDLKALAESLGSDVPFFLQGGTCLVTGRGEQVSKIDPLPKLFLVVIYPGVNISTAWAYSRLSLSLTKRPKYSKIKKDGVMTWRHLGDVKRIMANDFEPLILSHFPEVAKAKSDLKSWGAVKALLSGSGSSVFGLFPDAASARRAWHGLGRLWPQSFLAATIKAETYIKTAR